MVQSETLPSLPLAEWQETYTTLHLWTQIVGKVRLALASMVNHWWQVPLYISPRGLTTSPMPAGQQSVQIDFDFIDRMLWVSSSSGETRTLPLAARPVADFYRELMYHPGFGEYMLPYEAVRTSPDWEELVLSFFQTTYEAKANLAQWDREAYERSNLVTNERNNTNG